MCVFYLANYKIEQYSRSFFIVLIPKSYNMYVRILHNFERKEVSPYGKIKSATN